MTGLQTDYYNKSLQKEEAEQLASLWPLVLFPRLSAT